MEARPDAGIDQNARFTLEEAAFLTHTLWSLPQRAPLPLVDEVRLALDTAPAAEGPEQRWGFERENLLRKLARLTPFQQQAIRDAIAKTDLQTVIGPVKFNADGTGQVISIVTQYQDGKQLAVWPTDQAAAKPIYPAKPFADR